MSGGEHALTAGTVSTTRDVTGSDGRGRGVSTTRESNAESAFQFMLTGAYGSSCAPLSSCAARECCSAYEFCSVLPMRAEQGPLREVCRSSSTHRRLPRAPRSASSLRSVGDDSEKSSSWRLITRQ